MDEPPQQKQPAEAKETAPVDDDQTAVEKPSEEPEPEPGISTKIGVAGAPAPFKTYLEMVADEAKGDMGLVKKPMIEMLDMVDPIHQKPRRSSLKQVGSRLQDRALCCFKSGVQPVRIQEY